jgi:hypothetical protein
MTRETPFRGGAACFTNALSKRRISRQLFDPSRKRPRVARHVRERIAPGRQEFSGATRLAGHNGFAAGHGFGDHKPKRLGVGAGVHHDVECTNRGSSVVHKAGEAYARAKSERCGFIPKFCERYLAPSRFVDWASDDVGADWKRGRQHRERA